MIKIYKTGNNGNGIEERDGKLHVKAADATIEVGADGIKVATGSLPQAPKAVSGISVQGNALQVAFTDNTNASVDLPAPTVDVKLQGAEITTDNKLKLTLSDGSEIEAELSKFVDAPKSAQDYWNEMKALPTFAQDIKDAIKGEEVQDLAGNVVGYFVAA